MVSIKKINGISLIASKLEHSVNISLSGDITGSMLFDGSENITISSNLSNTDNARNNLGLGNVSILNTGTTSGNIPIIGINNKLDDTIIPYPAILEHHADRHAANGEDEITSEIFMGIVTKAFNSNIGGTPLPENLGGTGCNTQAQLGAWIGSIFTTTYPNNFLHGSKHALDSDDPLTANQIGAVDLTDPRLTDARYPTIHANTHMIDGTDVINPIDIGAATVNHVHNIATTTEAGFLPTLPISENTKILSGLGTWIDVPDSVTKLYTTNAVIGEMTKVENHWGVAISSTIVIGAGIITYGNDLTIGANVYVNDITGEVSYALSNIPGTYVHIGVVKSSNEISISEVQIKYNVI